MKKNNKKEIHLISHYNFCVYLNWPKYKHGSHPTIPLRQQFIPYLFIYLSPHSLFYFSLGPSHSHSPIPLPLCPWPSSPPSSSSSSFPPSPPPGLPPLASGPAPAFAPWNSTKASVTYGALSTKASPKTPFPFGSIAPPAAASNPSALSDPATSAPPLNSNPATPPASSPPSTYSPIPCIFQFFLRFCVSSFPVLKFISLFLLIPALEQRSPPRIPRRS